MVNQSGVSFLSIHNFVVQLFFLDKTEMSFSSIFAVHLVQEPFSSSLFVAVFVFNFLVVIVMFSCFFASLSCATIFYNHCTFLLCLVGPSSHLRISHSWLLGLMSLLIFSFSSLSNNFACFV